MRHPGRQAFAEMVRSPECQAVAHLRTEGPIEATLRAAAAMAGARVVELEAAGHWWMTNADVSVAVSALIGFWGVLHVP